MKELPEPFRLRPLEPADIPDVLAIEQLSFPTPRKEAIYLYELTQNQLAHYHALTWLRATGEEILLGYAGFWILSDEIHISTIAVNPAFRRRGFGQLLLLNIMFLSYRQEASLVTLEVRQTNLGAQEMYRTYRFSEVGLRRGYYRDTGEDAILMTVMLKGTPDYRAFLVQKRDSLLRQLAPTP